jgi:phage terminase small subunit
MRPGPKPHPASVQLLRGERRPSRVNRHAPTAPIGLGEPPEHLSPESRAVWLELAPQLERSRIATTLDRTLFAVFVDAVSDYRALRLDPSKHPTFATGKAKLVARLAAEFGLSPSSRTRLIAGAAPEQKAESFEDFVARRPRQ